MTTRTPSPHEGHRARLQQRVYETGTDSLLDHEFLELLLTYAIARKDTKPIAWALLKRFGSFSAVLDANEAALQDIPGIGPRTAQLLLLVRDSFKRYSQDHLPKRIKLKSMDDVLDYCKSSLAGKQEEFLEVIFLSVRCTIIRTRRVACGAIASITLDPRQIVELALKEKASGIILVHNHPSGDPRPSADDIAWTKELEKATKLFGITLWEHFVVSRQAHFSFRAHQLLEPVQKKKVS